MTSTPNPEVQTEAGTVRGFWREAPSGVASAAFLGIPFAEAPVGELRFAAPVPHRPWPGVRDALEFGATPQRGQPNDFTLIPEPSYPGESTLNLNLFTPRPELAADGGLPVLVYIHGGGYVSGSPSSPWYDGQAFNRDGVIVVSISYRLGFDGFGWISDAPQNRGVLDWLLALEWVQANIAAFGGDPQRVTISGQSAGAGAALTLLGMPNAQHLFRAVFSISGPPTAVPAQLSEQLGRTLAELAGVEPTRAALSTLSEERILELQAKVSSVTPVTEGSDSDADAPADPLAGLVALVSTGLALGPIVDGDLIPMPTIDALASGIGADKELVLGATDNEFNMVLAGAREQLAGVPAAALLSKLGLAPTAIERYVAGHPGLDTADTVGQYLTDFMFRAPMRALAEARAEHAAGDPTAAPTWVYRFAWSSPTMGGACHCLDVPFFFDCLAAELVGNLAGPSPSQELATEVHGAAVGLVTGIGTAWPEWTNEDRAARVFDSPVSSVIRNALADVEAFVPERAAV